MTDWDYATFENNLIADMRANGGKVTSGPMAGKPVLVMTSTGAVSGEPRRAIVNFSRDGSDYVIAGTANGAPTDPAWVKNVRATSDVTVEADGSTFDATASLPEGPERDRLWDQHVAVLPNFGAYPEQSGRVIPMIRLTPKR
jgi:deazaflavin-dependent oxidoreductase (nitroreductase family)